MTAGGILLGMLYVALGDFSASIIGTEFPILVPILVYTQELLISFIQAFVFPLLIAIFVKVAKLH
jgi:F0F1-type ATP synthase membrane subunit a